MPGILVNIMHVIIKLIYRKYLEKRNEIFSTQEKIKLREKKWKSSFGDMCLKVE